MENLYTIICQYRGGVYVSQVQAPDEVVAVEAWAKRFREEKPAPKGSKRLADNALANLGEFPPTPLSGLVGLWYFGAYTKNHQAHCNMVLTVAGAANAA